MSRIFGAAVSTSINFTAQVMAAVIPALLMLVTFPAMKAELSATSFATFAFLFTTISFMSVLDAGLGRAVTYFAARDVAAGRMKEATRSLWAAIALGLAVSVVVVSVAFLSRGFLSGGQGSVSGVDFAVVEKVVWFLPVFICGSLLRGFLEAEQRFLATTAVQLLHGIVIAAAPLVCIRFTSNVDIYPAVFGLARLTMVIAYLLLIFRTQGWALLPDRHVFDEFGDVMRYARWLFASNLIGIAIVYADRILVAANLTAELVSAYIVPMDLVLRGQILIGALATVLFPIFVREAAKDTSELVANALRVQVAIFGMTLLVSAAAAQVIPILLREWMGGEFSANAALIARIALVGLAPVGCAGFSMTVLNAQGRTAHPAALHVLELLFYIPLLWAATLLTDGLTFIVATWLGRVCWDMAGMQLLMLRAHPRGTKLWVTHQLMFVATLGLYFFFAAEGDEGSGAGFAMLGLIGGAMVFASTRGIYRSLLTANGVKVAR